MSGWKEFVPKTKIVNVMEDEVSVRKDAIAISGNLAKNFRDLGFDKLKIYLNKDTGEVGLRGDRKGLKLGKESSPKIRAESFLKEHPIAAKHYPASWDLAQQMVIFKPWNPELVYTNECPEGMGHPLELESICKNRCEFYKRHYGDNPVECKWAGWQKK